MSSKYVKCPVCEKQIVREDGVKMGRRYYCPEHAGENIPRDSVYSNLCDIIGQNKSSILFKEIAQVGKEYGLSKLNQYLEENKTYLQRLFSAKKFSTEYAKIRYLVAILNNNLPNFEIKEEIPVAIEIDYSETRSKKKTKRGRRGLCNVV